MSDELRYQMTEEMAELFEEDGFEDISDGGIELDEDRYEHFRTVADPGQTLIRIDKFLVDRMNNATRSRIQQAAEAGAIFVNGLPVRSNYRIKPGDVVTLELLRPRRELEIIPEDIPLDIVYEDDVLLVVNKPAGLVVHPGHGNYTGTLVNALAYYLRDDPEYDPMDPRL